MKFKKCVTVLFPNRKTLQALHIFAHNLTSKNSKTVFVTTATLLAEAAAS